MRLINCPVRRLAVLAVALLTGAPAQAASHAAAGRATPSQAPAILDFDRMDVNNLDMVVTNFGSFGYDVVTGNGGLIYPRGTGRTAVFASGAWMGALVGGEVRVAVAEYLMEYTPGPMVGGTFQADRAEFRNDWVDPSGVGFADYLAYAVPQGAPVDGSGNPLVFGDATVWSVYNDADPSRHTNQAGSTAPLGVEIQQTTFAFHRAGPLGNTIFLKFRIENKGSAQLDQAYFGAWCDPDLGGASDDLVACDTTLSLGYVYNATNQDQVYGSTPPAVGFTLLQGPLVPGGGGAEDTLGLSVFAKYIGGTDPANALETYRRMQGLDFSGNPIHVMDDSQLPVTTFEVSGDPVTGTGWLDVNPADRRFLLTSGPFTMNPGDVQEVTYAIVIGAGSDRLSSITALRSETAFLHSAWPVAPSEPAPVRIAGLDLDPNVILTVARATWISAYVEPVGFDVNAIDPSSIRLAGVAPVPGMEVIGDHDQDGAPDLALKFIRSALISKLAVGDHLVSLTGSLDDGSRFIGSDQLEIVAPVQHPAPTIAPNPLNPTGTLTFFMWRDGPARVTLYDAWGRFIRTILPRTPLSVGDWLLTIDSRDGRGVRLGSGVYFAKVEAAGEIKTARLVILR